MTAPAIHLLRRNLEEAVSRNKPVTIDVPDAAWLLQMIRDIEAQGPVYEQTITLQTP